MPNEQKIKKIPRFFHWTTVFSKNQKTFYKFDCKSCKLYQECNLSLYKDKYNSCPVTMYIAEQLKNHILAETYSFFSDAFYLNCIQKNNEINTTLYKIGKYIEENYQSQK